GYESIPLPVHRSFIEPNRVPDRIQTTSGRNRSGQGGFMRHITVRTFAIGALAALALAACGSSSKSSAPPATSPPTEAPAAATTTTAGSSSSSAKATVSLASVDSAKTGGKKVLVDANGKTLYVWDNDKTAGKADCTGACAKIWPPLYVTGTPTYG